jgi:hypothetical protein
MGTFSRGTPLEPWYVTGLCEGQGSFTYSKGGDSLSLYFSLKLTGEDRALVEAVRSFFGRVGKIYDNRAVIPRSASAGFTKRAAYFRVNRIRELLAIVDHFDRFPLRGTKAASYAIWRRMALLKQAFRRSDKPTLLGLAAKLSAAAPHNKPWVP